MLSAVATVLLVPPVNLVALALVAVLAGWRRLAGVCLVLVLLLAMPGVSWLLIASLEGDFAASAGSKPQAIVILGGNVRHVAATPAREEVGDLTLGRLRDGAALARATRLPILVTGGVVGGAGDPPVAVLMARSLAADFATPARWQETASRNTWENARLSAAILRPAGIRAVYLVTDPWHMRRALMAFAGTGLAVTPAPLPPDRMPRLGLGAVVPTATAWRRSYYALHEWIGCAWYAVRRIIG